MDATREWRWALQLGLFWTVAACGGGDRAGRTDTTGMSSVPPAGEAAPAAADTAQDTSMATAPTPGAPAADSAAGKAGDAGAAKPADTSAKRTAAKPPAPPAPAAPKPAGGEQSPQQVALGDSIFHGQVAGGTCTACHGQDAKGTAVGPDLTDSQWLNGDGTYDFIVGTITNGVPQPKQHPAPMPPKGGAALSDEQVKAAAAYVFSLSHKS